jgi:hypothetical protein
MYALNYQVLAHLYQFEVFVENICQLLYNFFKLKSQIDEWREFMNRIVNVTGFSYSGMSGIVDFLLEYGFFYNADGVETFQYDCSDGLFQLEDKLFATISGGDNTEAILRFREMTINAFYFKQVMTSTCRFFTDEEIDYRNKAKD